MKCVHCNKIVPQSWLDNPIFKAIWAQPVCESCANEIDRQINIDLDTPGTALYVANHK